MGDLGALPVHLLPEVRERPLERLRQIEPFEAGWRREHAGVEEKIVDQALGSSGSDHQGVDDRLLLALESPRRLAQPFGRCAKVAERLFQIVRGHGQRFTASPRKLVLPAEGG